MTVSPTVLAIIVAVAALLVACWFGAGVILYPPRMSRNDVYPEQFGLRYEKVSFKSADGVELRGWFLPSPHGPSERRTILMCHGWGDNKGDLLKFTHYLNEKAGFNLFYFDFRSHGESGGEITTMGFYEIRDFAAAIDYLRREKPAYLERLGVFGLSMGAAVAAMALPEHPEAKAVVLESPFTTYRRVVRQYGWIHHHVPYWPLVWIALLFLKIRVGEPRVDEYSPLNFIKRIAPRPLLMIGGGDDRLMLESDVRELFDAAGDPKQLWIIPGATHGKCHETGGLEYETRIAGFFSRNL